MIDLSYLYIIVKIKQLIISLNVLVVDKKLHEQEEVDLLLTIHYINVVDVTEVLKGYYKYLFKTNWIRNQYNIGMQFILYAK